MSELESKKMSLLKIIKKLSTKIGGANLLNLAQDVLQSTPSAEVDVDVDYEIVKIADQFEIHPAAEDEYDWHYDKESPTIAYLSEGNFVIAWAMQDYEFNLRKHIWAEIYSNTGEVEIQKIRVNTTTGQNQYNPTIASLSDGGFVIAWENADVNSIYAQMYIANNFTMNGAEFKVNTSGTGSLPTIASLSDGGFVIAWDSNGDVYAQMYNSGGIANTDVGEFKVNGDDESAYTPTIASLSDGGFVIAWYSNGYVYAKRYNTNTILTSGSVLNVNTTATTETLTTIASLSDGGFVIAWDSNGDVYAQGYNSDGTKKTDAEFKVNTTATTGKLPTIASLSDGGFVIAWETIPSPANDIYAQGYNSDGTKKTNAEFKVNPPHPATHNDEKLHFFSTIASDDGHLAIAWTTWLTVNYYGYRIFAQIYELSAGHSSVDDSHSNASIILEFNDFEGGGEISFQTDDILPQQLTKIEIDSVAIERLKTLSDGTILSNEALYVNILNSTVTFTGGSYEDGSALKYIDENGNFPAPTSPPITLSPFYNSGGPVLDDQNWSNSNLMFYGSFSVDEVQKAIIDTLPGDAGYISDYLDHQHGTMYITPL